MNQRGKPPARVILALVIIILLGVVTIVAGATVLQLPSPATVEAKRTHNLYEAVLIVSLVVFYAVTSGTIWAMLRYKRQSPDEELPVQVHGSNVLEATWTIIPVIILVALFIPSLMLVIDLKKPPANPDVEVNVIGHQWWWQFDYPNDGISVQKTPPDYSNLTPPTLVLPVGSEVVLHLTSTDVVHSFYAPHTLYKMQAIPGNVNTMHMKFDKVGVFHGQCYQFCGLHHADMLFTIDVRSQADYEAWVKSTQKAQGVDPSTLVDSSPANKE